eukprot:4887928-Pyramimonas_sp.AAC.1
MSENVRTPRFSYDKQRQISEWLATALRHEPFREGRLSDRFLRGVPSCDECDGWAELSQLLKNWPAEGHENYHRKHLGTVRHKLKYQHWACQALAVLDLIGMVDHAEMQTNRLQPKKMKCSSDARRVLHPSNTES